MNAHHRKDDPPDETHVDERETAGWTPSRGEWMDMFRRVEQIGVLAENNNTQLCDINKALWGSKRDGIDSNGGIVAEVRALRNIKKIAWAAVSASCLAVLNSIAEWITGKVGQ